MLIGNYSVFNKNPGRYFAGSSTCDRSAWNQSGAQRNFYYGDHLCETINITTTRINPSLYYGKIPGYNTGYMLPQKSGGMSNINGIIGTGVTNNPNLAGGLNGASDLTGSGTINTATISALSLIHI